MTVGLLSFTLGQAFNLGKSQGQSQLPGIANDWPFLNLAKQAGSWQGRDSFNSGAIINPSWLGSDGYPLASALSGTGGVQLAVSLPPQASFTANVKILWDVTGAGPSDVVQMQVANMSNTFVATNVTNGGSGNFSSTGNGTDFFYTFTPGYSNSSFNLGILALGGTAHVQNLRVVFDDGTRAQLLAQGKMFDPQFKSILQQANFGVYRFKDVLITDTSNVTSWSTRKSQSYVSWVDSEWRASLYAGITTNSGNDYSITFGSGAPADKQTMHLRFNADATVVQNSTSGNGGADPGTLSVSGIPGTVTFNWTAHPLVNGNIISINIGTGGNNMQGTSPGTNYYVVNKAANTFQVSLTPGGTAISSTSAGTNTTITRMQTLNLNSSGPIPIRLISTLPIIDPNLIPKSLSGPNEIYGTVVFDADLQTWLLSGGSAGANSVGLNSGIPIEVCLQLCKEIGFHPHWSIPPHALDPATDYVTGVASLCQSSGPSWMIPHFEPSNEVWNSALGFIGFQIAANKAFGHWGGTYTALQDDWYGKVLSVMGQGVASVYGLGNLGTKYEVMCGVGTTITGTDLVTGTFTGSLAANVLTATGVTSGVGGMGVTNTISGTGVTGQPRILSQLTGTPGFDGTYSVSGPAQTVGSEAMTCYQGPPDVRLTSAAYVAQAAAPQSGYLKAAAYTYTSAVLPATYITPTMYGTNAELQNAWGYYVTNVGNPTAQAANLNTYVDTLNGAAAFANLAYVSAIYQNFHLWASGFGVNKMFAYEGGYSPDLVGSDINVGVDVAHLDHQWQSPITGATNVSPCVLTLATTSYIAEGFGLAAPATGNPAIAGMVLCVLGVGGATGLNCQNGAVATFTNGSASIAMTNTLVAGQCVQFRPEIFPALPTNITADTKYFVIATGLSGSAFQISLAKGGSPITIAVAGGGTNTTTAQTDSGWNVTNVIGNSVTVDIPSAPGVYTSGGTAFYLGSTTMVNNFRLATMLFATDLQGICTTNFNNFVSAGGAFPSQYELAGVAAWPCIQPDIWGTKSGEFAAIVAYNH